MFAIAFDLVVADAAANHPKGVSQAYADIGAVLSGFSFDRVQGSLYLTNKDDLANLFAAIMALKVLPWFAPPSGISGPSRSSTGLISHCL